MTCEHEFLGELRAFNARECQYVITHALGIEELQIPRALKSVELVNSAAKLPDKNGEHWRVRGC